MKTWKEALPRARTLAELYGADRLLVEAHRGVLGYGTDCIRIGATYGSLIVRGEDLRLCCMSREQLVVRGSIRQVEMEVSR